MIHLPPLNTTSFTSASGEMAFNIPSNPFNMESMVLVVRMYCDTANTTFNPQSGAVSVIDRLTFECGGDTIDNIQSYAALVVNNLSTHQTYGTGYLVNGGTSSKLGRGATLPITAGTAVEYHIPLTFSFTDAKFKINFAQFSNQAKITLTLAGDSVALNHATLTPSYTISKAWIQVSRAQVSECIPFVDNMVLNATVTRRSISTNSEASGTIQLSQLNSNTTRLLVSCNTGTSGYTNTAKSTSDITKLTDFTCTISGQNFPENTMSLYGIKNDLYTMTLLSTFPQAMLSRPGADFIPYDSYIATEGYISIPVFSRGSKRAMDSSSGGINKYLLGSPILNGDNITYTQTSATAGTKIIIHSQFTMKLIYKGGNIILVQNWPMSVGDITGVRN